MHRLRWSVLFIFRVICTTEGCFKAVPFHGDHRASHLSRIRCYHILKCIGPIVNLVSEFQQLHFYSSPYIIPMQVQAVSRSKNFRLKLQDARCWPNSIFRWHNFLEYSFILFFYLLLSFQFFNFFSFEILTFIVLFRFLWRKISASCKDKFELRPTFCSCPWFTCWYLDYKLNTWRIACFFWRLNALVTVISITPLIAFFHRIVTATIARPIRANFRPAKISILLLS